MAIRHDRAGIVVACADLRKDHRRQSEGSIGTAINASLKRSVQRGEGAGVRRGQVTEIPISGDELRRKVRDANVAAVQIRGRSAVGRNPWQVGRGGSPRVGGVVLTGLWTWADDSFEKKTLSNTYTLEGAIPLAREADASDLFEHSNDENEEELVGMRRGAVAATAAVVLNFREGRTQEDLGWARDVLQRASFLSEKPDLMWSPRSAIP